MDFLSQPGLNCLVEGYSYKVKIIAYLLSVPFVLAVLALPTMFLMVVGAASYGSWSAHPKFTTVTRRLLWLTLCVLSPRQRCPDHASAVPSSAIC
jgi:hypothetical protein